MNRIIFFIFTIINSINGCVYFKNNRDGYCSEFNETFLPERHNLQCIFHNALAEINSTTCKEKKFDNIVVRMYNLNQLEHFCLHNNKTVMELFKLFKRQN